MRDRLLGRPVDDVDVALDGDLRRAAREIARETRGAAFQLSGDFGAWRVVGPGHAWHVDLVTLRDGDIAADLAARDFTINAMAEPLGGGELLDPHGGRDDLAARRVRMVSAGALAEDPLRSLRAVRLVTELDLELDPATGDAVRANAPGIERVAPERVFGELKRVVTAARARTGLELMDAYGLTDVVLPELAALRGVEQNEYHHADVHDHTLEVLEAVASLERGDHGEDIAALLSEPLADELTKGGGMRFAALLHDAAKPATRGERPDGRVTFIGHDAVGAELARTVLKRLRASQKLTDYVAALTLHHLRLGFLVHERPLERRSVWRYLRATRPYSSEVTIFTVADRLATRGRNSGEAIAAHLALAREMLGHALAAQPAEPLVRGDELARELGIRPGPGLGELLAQLEEDRFAGEIATREDALRRARELVRSDRRRRPRQALGEVAEARGDDRAGLGDQLLGHERLGRQQQRRRPTRRARGRAARPAPDRPRPSRTGRRTRRSARRGRGRRASRGPGRPPRGRRSRRWRRSSTAARRAPRARPRRRARSRPRGRRPSSAAARRSSAVPPPATIPSATAAWVAASAPSVRRRRSSAHLRSARRPGSTASREASRASRSCRISTSRSCVARASSARICASRALDAPRRCRRPRRTSSSRRSRPRAARSRSARRARRRASGRPPRRSPAARERREVAEVLDAPVAEARRARRHGRDRLVLVVRDEHAERAAVDLLGQDHQRTRVLHHASSAGRRSRGCGIGWFVIRMCGCSKTVSMRCWSRTMYGEIQPFSTTTPSTKLDA